MKTFRFKNFTILSCKHYIELNYKNCIGVVRSKTFSKNPCMMTDKDKFKHLCILDNESTKTNLQTTYLYYENEKDVGYISLIIDAFDKEEFTIELI